MVYILYLVTVTCYSTWPSSRAYLVTTRYWYVPCQKYAVIFTPIFSVHVQYSTSIH